MGSQFELHEKEAINALRPFNQHLQGLEYSNAMRKTYVVHSVRSGKVLFVSKWRGVLRIVPILTPIPEKVVPSFIILSDSVSGSVTGKGYPLFGISVSPMPANSTLEGSATLRLGFSECTGHSLLVNGLEPLLE